MNIETLFEFGKITTITDIIEFKLEAIVIKYDFFNMEK